MKKTLGILAVTALTCCFSNSSEAVVILSASQNGSDVTIEVSGSLDLTGLAAPSNTSTLVVGFRPGDPKIGRSVGSLDVYDVASTPFGSNGGSVIANGSGDDFYLSASQVFLDQGYTSGTPLSLTISAENKTLADFGWTPGDQQVITTLPNDQILFEVAAIPEPTAIGLMLLGLASLVSKRRA